MAYSDISICNLALAHIRAASIVSLTEGSNEAIQCSAQYAHVRDMALRDYPWNFARAQSTLGLLASDIAGLWTYRYGLPSDCLLVREIEPLARTDDPVPYEIAYHDGRRVLLTDRAEPTLIYTARVDDPTLFDPLFVEALSWALAMRLAVPITGDRQLMSDAATMYQNTIQSAWRADGNEGQPEDDREASWTRARF